MASREDTVRRVQALWNQADDKGVTAAERDAFLAKATELMAKFDISELELSAASGVEEAVVLTDIRLFKDDAATIVPEQRMKLAHYIAVHNHCSGIVTHLPASVGVDGTIIHAGQYLRIVGYKSDTMTVRLLYKSLVTDMLDSLGMEPTSHMKKGELANYQQSFGDGFAQRVNERLAAIATRVEKIAETYKGGSLLPALLDKKSQVEKKVNEMYPNLASVQVKRYAVDPNAMARGAKAADGSDIGQTKVGGGSKGELGS